MAVDAEVLGVLVGGKGRVRQREGSDTWKMAWAEATAE